MTYSTVNVDVSERIAWLTIHHPPANALNAAAMEELGDALDRLEQDGEVKAVVITGEGRFFIAGADIKEFTQLGPAEAKKLSETGQTLFRRIETFEKPVIAAINGACLGGGLELAMACHVRLAAAEAKLGLPELNLGIIPGYGGTQRLPRLVGRGRATQMILSSQAINGEEAFRIGLVEGVYPPDQLLAEAGRLAASFAEKSSVAVAAALEAIDAGYREDAEDGYEKEAEQFGHTFSSQDAREGIAAFIEKRKPVFIDK